MRAHLAARLFAASALVATSLAGCGSTPAPTAAPGSAAMPNPTRVASAAPTVAPTAAPSSVVAPTTDVVDLGNLPNAGVATPDGRYLWTVSAGLGADDVRIVDTTTRQVCQVIAVPGASGGIALDDANHLAYVSGLTVSRWRPSEDTLPGAKGNVVLVYRYTDACGEAAFDRVIEVPPPADAPTIEQFPPVAQRNQPDSTNAWPERLAVSPDGSRLLVPLNLADRAAVVKLDSADAVTYVNTGSGAFPFAAAILPDSKTGLVTNEGLGTVSVIDLDAGTKTGDITVGAPLSHPEGIVVDAAGERAYVALTNSDLVSVVDLAQGKVERTISVGRPAGLGTQPLGVALDPANARLYVVEYGADEIAVIHVPAEGSTSAEDWQVIGRIPTAKSPEAVTVVPAHDGRPAELAWVSERGVAYGANPTGPNPTDPNDPIFWAFNKVAPTTDIFEGSTTYLGALQRGEAGFVAVPTDAQIELLTKAADAPLDASRVVAAPADTVVRSNGPIKHVFFIVRENRSYDQLLGDLGMGNGDPSLTVFGATATPNLHALVARFGLFDNVLANSEASIQGHYWTAAGIVPDYIDRNWTQNYAGRGRPNDFGQYAITWPGNGFLFNQAEKQGISYFNYGEGFDGGEPDVADRNRDEAGTAAVAAVSANSDLGPQVTKNGCYPSDLTIGTALDGGQMFDSSLPAGAKAGSHSHYDCFKARFEQQLASGAVPALSYLSLTSDHTRGTEPGYPVPTAMVADSDQAIGQLVDLISHSSIWMESAIFIVEDDSQDGADHVDAHRIPVAVISPYAKQGSVLSTKYDLLSFVRTIELIIGMEPLSLNDALATPLYDAFSPTPDNAAPYTNIAAKVDLLEMNQPGNPWAEGSTELNLAAIDEADQAALDAILWHSVYGADTVVPPPGPNAENAEAEPTEGETGEAG